MARIWAPRTREPETVWQDYGLCREVDPDLFFPEVGEVSAANNAKRVCALCPVLNLCRDYALSRRIRYGVWGGMSEEERRRVFRRQRLAQAA